MKRDLAIDRTRGLAILLVAAFHMTGGLVTAGKLENTPMRQFAASFAYGCHVQIFFLISGFFLYGRMTSWGNFAPRAINLYYPYLLWAFVSAALMMFGGAANHPPKVSDIALIPVVPIAHYWFLLCLIAAMAALVAVKSRVEIACAGFLALNVVLMVLGASHKFEWSAAGVSYWVPFILFGASLAKHGFEPRANWAAFLVALVIGAASVALSFRTGIYIRNGVFFISSLAMCYALYCVSAWARVRWLAYVGELSLVIYLTHVIFGTAIRAAAFKLWPQVPVEAVAVVGLAASVILPIGLYRAAAMFGFARLLGFEPLLVRGGNRAPMVQTSPQ